MEAGERTRDIFEHIPAYAQPPLIPLPRPGDTEPLRRLGIELTPLSRGIVRAAMALSGFRRFQGDLPGRLEDLLRHTELRGAALFAPVISGTLALRDDPQTADPLRRAAALLRAVRSLREDVVNGTLPADEVRGRPLEMGQYPNLFGTSLMVEGERSRMFKSTDTEHLAIIAGRRFFRLHAAALGWDSSTAGLEHALRALVRTVGEQPLVSEEQSPGVLTCANHPTQLRILSELGRHPENARSLRALRHSVATLCLDLEHSPANDAEAALLAHAGNCANRWYHSSLQIVVFGNAKVCLICSFSAYLDGNTMMRAAAEIQRRGAGFATDAARAAPDAQPLSAEELRWNIPRRYFLQASREFGRVRDNQQATFEMRAFGCEFFERLDLDPVPGFILALQAVGNRLTGREPRITQFLAMSRYRCGDLITAVVSTPEVLAFVKALEGPGLERAAARALAQAAVESQTAVIRSARQQLPIEAVMGLFLHTRGRIARVWAAAVGGIAGGLLRALGLHRRQPREILVSHPEIYPEVTIVGRPGVRLPYVNCFGLHYQIMEDRTVVTFMPGVRWTASNADVAAEIEESLRQIQSRLE